MDTQISRRIRSIVDKSLVHCHRGCEFEPRHSNILFYLIFYQLLIEPWYGISNDVAFLHVYTQTSLCGRFFSLDSQNAVWAVARYS